MRPSYTEKLKGKAYYAYHLALCAWYVAARPSLSPTRFIIFGRGRSGSTALVNLLHQVDGVHCDGEILRHSIPFPRLHIDAMCGRTTAAAYGCKVLSFHLSSVQHLPSGRDFLSDLLKEGFRIIYLRRDNLFRHALSNIHARRYQFHHNVKQGSVKHSRLMADPGDVLQWMKGSAALEQYERDVLEGIPHLSISYEDDLEDDSCHQATVDNICGHLGIASNTVRCEYRKITPTSSRDLLVNFDEVQAFLSETSFARYVS